MKREVQEPRGDVIDSQARSRDDDGSKTVVLEWNNSMASDVQITGSFCNWGDPVAMQRDAQVPDKFLVSLDVPKGRLEFKFIVDGRWLCSERYETCKSGVGENNVLFI